MNLWDMYYFHGTLNTLVHQYQCYRYALHVHLSFLDLLRVLREENINGF